MEVITGVQYLPFFDFNLMGVVFELLLVTACISTIIYITTKNQYISYLSAAPIFYLFSWISHGVAHFILLILSMTLQAGIILIINRRQSKKQVVLNKSK